MTKSVSPIRVAVAGATGKMGRQAVQALQADDRFQIAAILVRRNGQAVDTADWPVYDHPERLLTEASPDVWLDLTDARSVVAHVNTCLEYGVRPVVGATGYTPENMQDWRDECQSRKLGAIVAPNFSMGALLMMRFAVEAARYLPNVEIIELHHDGKRDAPSGTARRTAQAIAESRQDAATVLRTQIGQADAEASRGLVVDGVPIHSIRLPGLVAHQQVMFGGTGEVLTIQHDSMSRESFMPGVLLACTRVMQLNHLIYGLEHLLW